MVNVGEKDAYRSLGAERAENEGFGCDRKAKHADPAYTNIPNARLRLVRHHELSKPRLMQDGTPNQFQACG